MKVFILCGGSGTRLDELGKIIAKPMVRVGNKPLLIHIIENFCIQGFKEFVLCTGHKHKTIENYFLVEKKKYSKINKSKSNQLTVRYDDKKIRFNCEIIFTGHYNGTGGRVKIAYKKLKLKDDIIMTYGDGLSNVNINKLVNFHYKNNAMVTLTAVRPKVRYGVLKIQNNKVVYFDNSNQKKVDVYINGGFFVISKRTINYIQNKNIYWEQQPLEKILKKKKIYAYKHHGYWQSLETLKDQNDLNKQFKQKKILWKYNENRKT